MCIACEMGFWEAMEETAPEAAMPQGKMGNVTDPFVCDVPDTKPLARGRRSELTNEEPRPAAKSRKREQDS